MSVRWVKMSDVVDLTSHEDGVPCPLPSPHASADTTFVARDGTQSKYFAPAIVVADVVDIYDVSEPEEICLPTHASAYSLWDSQLHSVQPRSVRISREAIVRFRMQQTDAFAKFHAERRRA